jgi:hypothetical protein
MTVCSFSTLMTIAAAGATDFGAYGSAPPSLDFPSSGLTTDSEMRNQATLDVKKNSWNREEHSLLSAFDPFPNKNVAAVDPLSKQKVDRVLVGPAYRTRAYGSDYDYYRYVTFFNISTRKERVLRKVRSECFDKEASFSKVGNTMSFTASVHAGIDIEGIGISTDFSQTQEMSVEREFPAGGVVADYIPYALKEDWDGRTFRQLYSTRTGKSAFITKESKDSPWWVIVLFPLAAMGEKYPMDFSVRDADWTLIVDQVIIRTCDETPKPVPAISGPRRSNARFGAR